ncbi:glutathione peroxidase [Rhodovulum adriaticum]|uniref:Glutathione peroxidase n=1 Tax=Rhodovulum adriaticum TaxID=35804 RepID=A0A4R2NMW1_RHOAD|nr:glutathione peroxidase [Rhodovulum adriaticum]MBK1636373.1 glutathione peroxidase [Rhodovulum adriaticum]TCP22862.1 glutathione peroxidase [Rhodovulum adriaticum]
MRPFKALAALALSATTATAAPAPEGLRFAAIDGGEIALDDFRGQPVLVVNTASRCGFTPQYDGLQALYARYGPRGLVVLGVPSDDFNQELADEAAVKGFCEVNFNLTFPMTEITHVKGAQAHPFYRWLKAEHGFEPGWNFNKVLLGPDGEVVATYGSFTRPNARKLTARIEASLD